MSKRMRVLMLVLAVLMIVPSILAGCGGSEDPATTTTAATTAATTPDAGTTTAATTEAQKGLGGYEFYVQGDHELRTELDAGEEETEKHLELMNLYASIEEELDCSITFATLSSNMSRF